MELGDEAAASGVGSPTLAHPGKGGAMLGANHGLALWHWALLLAALIFILLRLGGPRP